jgi:E3 ubiquitin-protein ligase RNF115/126
MVGEGTSYSNIASTSTSTSIPTQYWCHSCTRVIQPLSEGFNIKCPNCQTGFIEEMDGSVDEAGLPHPIRASTNVAANFWAPIVLSMIRDSYGSNQQSWALPPSLLPLLDSDETDGMTIVLQGGDGNHLYGIPMRDYILGPGLEMLLQHLLDGDLTRHGTPPAQKEAVEAMPRVKIEEIVGCSVCLEDFNIGDEAREMPCKHCFHHDCIVPWLEIHSSCPVCRYEMPADEPKEEGISIGIAQRDETGNQMEGSQGVNSPRNRSFGWGTSTGTTRGSGHHGRRFRWGSLFHWITHHGSSSNSSGRTSR